MVYHEWLNKIPVHDTHGKVQRMQINSGRGRVRLEDVHQPSDNFQMECLCTA